MNTSEIVAIAQSLKASGASNDTKEDMAITLLSLGAFLTSKGNTTQYAFYNYMRDAECTMSNKFLEILHSTERRRWNIQESLKRFQ